MTAKDLLYKILEYNYLWSEDHVVNDKPSVIRRQQIEALQNAFGLSKAYVNPLVQVKYYIGGKREELTRAKQLNRLTNIEYLLHGEFLRDRQYEENHELTARALEEIGKLNGPEDRMKRPVDIGWMFNNLWFFRKDAYKLTYPDEGMLEGFSVGLLYSKHLQGKLKRIVSEELAEIDDTLWLILDPQRRDIPIEELVAGYRYPDVDLEKIDREWRMENY